VLSNFPLGGIVIPGIALTLAILIVATFLFISGWLRPDLVALLVLISLSALGIITQQEAFGGFSSSAVILLLSAFVISSAIQETGLGERLSAFLLRVSGRSEKGFLFALTFSAAFLSLFMNNIAAAAVLMPSAMIAMRRIKADPTKMLLPMAFATELAGMATLLTTSNLVMASVLHNQGLPSFGLLEFLPIGCPIALLGLGLMFFLAPRLLRARSENALLPEDGEGKPSASLSQLYNLQQELAVALVLPNSRLVNRTLSSCNLRQKLGLNVVAIIRNSKQVIRTPGPHEQVRARDRLVFTPLRTTEEELMAFGLELQPNADLSERLVCDLTCLVEAVITPRSSLSEKTLQQIQFHERYGLNVLAIWQNGKIIREGLEEVSLRFGDALLLQGPRPRIKLLRSNPDLLVLGEETPISQRRSKGWLALGIIAAALVIAATDWLPVAQTIFIGAVLLILTRCLSMEEAYAAIDWSSILLVGGMLPVGVALNKTGAAARVAELLVSALGHLGPKALLAGFFGFTVVLTQLIPGGAATPLVVGPLAISTALRIGANPRTFAMAVALATSTSFLTPFAHPVNVLVMGPGNYQFRDYVLLGLPLVILTLILSMILLPCIYPL